MPHSSSSSQNQKNIATCKNIAIKKLADQTGVTIDLINSFIHIKVGSGEIKVGNVELTVDNVEITVGLRWGTLSF